MSTSPRRRGEGKEREPPPRPFGAALARKGRGYAEQAAPTVMYDYLISPFIEFAFMRRALVGTLALALGAGPVGVFLMLRRMSLVGDAMAHAILPGAAIGFLLSGLSLFAMTAGGLIAGFVIAVGAVVIARVTELKEEAAPAALL